MSSRLVPFLLLTAMLYALGASVASLPPFASAKAVTAATPAPVAVERIGKVTLLPTVTVRPDDALAALMPSAEMLPTVSVRPSAAEIAAAKALDAQTLGTGVLVVAMHAAGGGMSPGSGLDMPYYSFGKSVYRLRKE